MSQEINTQNIDHSQTEETDQLEPPPNYLLGVLLVILKIILIAAAILSLAWALVSI